MNQLDEEKLFWGVDDIIKKLPYGKTLIEEKLLRDPRISRLQRQASPGGTRCWPARETAEAIKNIIMNEWN